RRRVEYSRRRHERCSACIEVFDFRKRCHRQQQKIGGELFLAGITSRHCGRQNQVCTQLGIRNAVYLSVEGIPVELLKRSLGSSERKVCIELLSELVVLKLGDLLCGLWVLTLIDLLAYPGRE